MTIPEYYNNEGVPRHSAGPIIAIFASNSVFATTTILVGVCVIATGSIPIVGQIAVIAGLTIWLMANFFYLKRTVAKWNQEDAAFIDLHRRVERGGGDLEDKAFIHMHRRVEPAEDLEARLRDLIARLQRLQASQRALLAGGARPQSRISPQLAV